MNPECSKILDCIKCVFNIPKCFFIDDGISRENWRCVSTTVGLSGVRLRIDNRTSEFCPESPTVVYESGDYGTVSIIALCLAIICFTAIIGMIFWLQSPKPRRSPEPDRSGMALRAITSFARQRERERVASREAFDIRNREFQRQLAERLQQINEERAARLNVPRNTPVPDLPSRHASLPPQSRHNSPLPVSRHNTPPPTDNTVREASLPPLPPPRSRGRTPGPLLQDDNQSRLPTPFLSRAGTPHPQSYTPPLQNAPNAENLYDSPASSIYESVGNSTPVLPSVSPVPPRFSSFGRLLKRTSFFKSNP